MQSFFARYYNMDGVLADINPLIKQTKLVLRIYREVQWALVERQHELQEQITAVGWNEYDTGIVYLTTFAPEADMHEFESKVCRLVENKTILTFINNCVQRLKRYPEFGSTYYDIVTLQFISHKSHGEIYMVNRLNMERSTFYRRKKRCSFLAYACLGSHRRTMPHKALSSYPCLRLADPGPTFVVRLLCDIVMRLF